MIRATLLLVCAACVIPRLRRRSAAERHLLWAAALGAASAMPVLGRLLPSWQPDWTSRLMAILPLSLDTGAPWFVSQTADIVVRANGIEPSPWSMGTLLPWLWIAGSVVAVIVLAVETLKLARLARAARPAGERRTNQIAADVAGLLRLTRPIRLLESPRGIVPMTWGVRRATVLLPASAADWPDDRTRAVLAHELAHVRRGDWLVHVLAELACALYWFNPFFWIAKDRLCRESEHAADDVVLGLGVEGGDYATHLLEIVRAAQAPVLAWAPTVAMARPSHLERRFAALLNAYANRGAATRWKTTAVMAVTLAAVIPVASMALDRAGIRIELRTSNLPAMTEGASLSSQEAATSPVRHLRVLGVSGALDAMTPPQIAEYTTPPLYSDEARARGIEGVVTVAAHVGVDGRVSGSRVVRGLGFGLDQNALVAVRQWRFRAGTRRGQAAAMDAEIDIEFSLRNEAVNELIANDMATRVGPGVTPPRAVRVFGVWPRRPRIEGTVVLDVVLLEDGTPRIVKILQSLDPELDESAVRNFEQWRFSPALKDGRPVKVRVNAEVHFHG